ncbi:hypothetical protein R1flu_008855 [Riccia fluitans]|uniref:C3H1-type domain-containing protein n=1 Tax=Riccia fluitans TaxID=41844 RepID=A0ABD1Z186_9MARC
MDEEALKKSTDCVYFLASPLTCKKGSDCEFRHSESARVNPRDCRYWLSGNCLNWDCPFRHPPLEGRPVVAANAPSVPVGVGNKSRTPCYYFAQGFCSRGELCQFMHGTPALASKSTAPQRPVRVIAPNGTGSTEKDSVPATNGLASKPHIQVTLDAQAPKEHASVGGGVQSSPRKEPRSHPSAGNNQNGGTAKGRADGATPATGHGSGGRLRIRQVQPGEDRVQNGVESDEWWEESSPGFDVLVDYGPEQSRYHADPEFQSAGEAAVEPGKGGPGSRGRGRSMRMGDEVDKYDYDYSHSYEHAKYEVGASYERGGYEYGVREQQGAYDPAIAYERMVHQRGGTYPERGGVEDMLARERLGLPMEVDGRPGGINDHRSRPVKRRRADGGQQHSGENHSRRQRTDMPMGEYHQHQRLHEDQQKQHELQLRHQLFMQHRVRNHNSNDNSSRRLHEKGAVESAGVARRALQDIGAEAISVGERVQTRPGLKGRHAIDHLRSGMREGELSRKDPHGEPEGRSFVDLDGNRKTEKEVRREPSTFAGPKTLAQIKAEKAKVQVDDTSKSKETASVSKAPVQVVGPSKGAVGRSQPQTSLRLAPDATSGDVYSAEERKARLEKVVSNESKKAAAFEGPKSLSAILIEKRKIDLDVDANQEAARSDHLQRMSPFGNTEVTATGVETGSTLESKRDEVNSELGTDADVEDGELLSDEEALLKSSNQVIVQGRHNYPAGHDDQLHESSPRDRQWQLDEAAHASQTVDGIGEEEAIEDYGDVQDYEDEGSEIFSPKLEDGNRRSEGVDGPDRR